MIKENEELSCLLSQPHLEEYLSTCSRFPVDLLHLGVSCSCWWQLRSEQMVVFGVTGHPRTPGEHKPFLLIMIWKPERNHFLACILQTVRVRFLRCDVMIALADCYVTCVDGHRPRVYLLIFRRFILPFNGFHVHLPWHVWSLYPYARMLIMHRGGFGMPAHLHMGYE